MNRLPSLLALLVLLTLAALLVLLGGVGRRPQESRPNERAAGADETAGRTEATAEPARGGGLRVFVVDAASQAPVSGARIRLSDLLGDLRLEGTTDLGGRADWKGERPFCGRMRVEAEGYGRVFAFFSILAGWHEETRVALPPPVTYHGVVVDAATGRPIAGAVVRLVGVDLPGIWPSLTFRAGPEWARARTDARGIFAFQDCSDDTEIVKPGLSASAEGYAPALEVAFDARPLLDGRGVTLRLPPAGRVSGRLLGPDGSGVAGEVRAAPVRLQGLLEAADDEWRPADGLPLPPDCWAGPPEGTEDLCSVVRTEADEHGHFAFVDLPLGADVVLEGRFEGLRTTRVERRVRGDHEEIVLRIPRR